MVATNQPTDETVGYLKTSWFVVTIVLISMLALGQLNVLGTGQLSADVRPTGSAPDPLEGLNPTRHAGVDMAVVDARVRSETEEFRAFVTVDLALANTTDVPARLSKQMVSLVDTEGVAREIHRFENTASSVRVILEPGERTIVSVAFRMPPKAEIDLSLLAVQISEPGRWPIVLPLEGAAPSPTQPTPLNVEVLRFDVGEDVELADFEASISLEEGIYRSRIGSRLAVVDVRLESSDEDELEEMQNRELWTLADAISPRRALWVDEVQRTETTVDLRIVFSYRIESSTLWLSAGPDERQLAVLRF